MGYIVAFLMIPLIIIAVPIWATAIYEVCKGILTGDVWK